MAEETTLSNMATFDVAAPIDVTVIYDDSDEDTNDIMTILSDEDQPKYVDEDTSLKEETYNNSHKRKLESNQQNILCSENISPENKKSRIQIDDLNKNKLEIPQISPKADYDANSNRQTVITTETSVVQEQKKFNQVQDTSLNNNDHKSEEDSMKKKFHEVSNYIHSLLTTVSEHLILIIKAFQGHSRIVSECQNRIDGNLRIQDSKARYFRYKTHIFQLSYSAVISVILEQETNNEFIEALINNTVKIANDKQLQLTSQYIKPFFYDLLFWTKQKRNYMNNYPVNEVQNTMEINKSNTPLLIKQLSEPSQPPQASLSRLPSSKKSNIKKKTNVPHYTSEQSPAISGIADYQKPHSIPIFSSGPPNREVSISVQSDLLHLQKQQMAQILNKRPCSPRAPPPSYYQHNSLNYNRQESYNAIERLSYIDSQHGNYNVVNNFAHSGNVAAGPTTTYNSSQQHIMQTPSDLNRHHSDQTRSGNTWYPPRSCVHQQSQPLPSLRTFRTHQSQHFYQGYGNYNQFAPADTNQYFSNEKEYAQNSHNVSPKKVVESGRSVSTDSGFVSPLQFNTGDKTPDEPLEQSNQFAPLITHVTSLNPNAVQITEGSCHVCAKPTKTKCMGCYQVYYCNYQCENADWSKHMYLCKRST